MQNIEYNLQSWRREQNGLIRVSSREVRFDEGPDRMKRKLEEMSTVATVHVELEPYPSTSGGGWGGIAVDDDTDGGYVWKVRREGPFSRLVASLLKMKC